MPPIVTFSKPDDRHSYVVVRVMRSRCGNTWKMSPIVRSDKRTVTSFLISKASSVVYTSLTLQLKCIRIAEGRFVFPVESIVRGLSKGTEEEAGEAIDRADEFLKKAQSQQQQLQRKKHEPRDNTGKPLCVHVKV